MWFAKILLHAIVQKQINGSDCGVFAIANAMAIVSGLDPQKQKYIIPQMRQHLHDCLSSKHMSEFPAMHRPIRGKKKLDEVEVFCDCRLQEYGNMAECDSCKEWFHSKCVKIPQTVWKHNSTTWLCPTCKQ